MNQTDISKLNEKRAINYINTEKYGEDWEDVDSELKLDRIKEARKKITYELRKLCRKMYGSKWHTDTSEGQT